jgi:hypothetical protein
MCFSFYLGISLMAVSEDGVVIGAILNNIMRRNDVNNCNNENCKESPKFNDITTFLDKAEREVDIFNQYPNVDLIMDMKIITVDKAYRGHGICKALVDKTKYSRKLFTFIWFPSLLVRVVVYYLIICSNV